MPNRLVLIAVLASLPTLALAQAQLIGPGAPNRAPVAPPSATPFYTSPGVSSVAPPVAFGGPTNASPLVAQPLQPQGAAAPAQPDSPAFNAAPSVRRAFRKNESARDRNQRRAFESGN